MRQGEPHPWQSTAYPEDQFIAAIGVDGAPVKITGEMLTACDGACFTVKPRAGEQASELAVSFAGHGAELLKPGVHSASIEIGSRRWTVRLNVLRRYPYLPFFYRAGYPTGCHNSDVHMQYEDTCVISNEQPADRLGSLEHSGDSFTDPQFGSPLHRLSGSGFSVQYSSVRMFSATSRYVLGADFDGFLQIWERATNQPLGARFSSATLSQTVWDPQVEERIWFLRGGQVGYLDVRTGAVTIAATYNKPTRNRPSISEMNTGGTADNTDDNWWVFTEPNAKLVCAIDLNGLAPANQEDHLFCSSYSALGIQLLDFPQITQVDRESKKRYVLLFSAPRAHAFSVNIATRKLDYEFEMPKEITTPHSDVGQDEGGRQVLFWTWYDRYGDKSFAATSLINMREKMTRPVEEGGGLSLLFPMYAGGIRTDAHFGCNWSAYCVLSMYADPVPGGIPNWDITDVKAGTPCVVQIEANHPFRDQMRAAIGGVGEMLGVNGVHQVKLLDSRTLALEGQSCSGQYRLKRGHIVEALQWAPTAPNRDQLIVVHLDGEVRPLAIHRSKLWQEKGDLNLYWASPQAGISRDGKYIGFTSNLGLPERNSILWAEVDLSGDIQKTDVRAAADTATIHWDGPDAAIVRVSAERDMDKPVFTRHFGPGQLGDRVITGLHPDTTYYYDIVGPNSAARGSFKTLKLAEVVN